MEVLHIIMSVIPSEKKVQFFANVARLTLAPVLNSS
jgi:hypothetical protein